MVYTRHNPDMSNSSRSSQQPHRVESQLRRQRPVVRCHVDDVSRSEGRLKKGGKWWSK